MHRDYYLEKIYRINGDLVDKAQVFWNFQNPGIRYDKRMGHFKKQRPKGSSWKFPFFPPSLLHYIGKIRNPLSEFCVIGLDPCIILLNIVETILCLSLCLKHRSDLVIASNLSMVFGFCIVQLNLLFQGYIGTDALVFLDSSPLVSTAATALF